MIGCGDYQVFVTTRGGGRLVGELAWTTLDWDRVLDDTSQASVDLLLSPECCGILAQTRQWQHELLIFRDGVPIWAGPIISPDINQETPRLTARDLSAWWDHRFVHETHNIVGQDLAMIFQILFVDAMGVENSSGQELTVTPCGVNGDLSVNATDYKPAGPIMRDLARAGIDWTVLLRQIIAGGAAVPVEGVGPFFLDHFRTLPDVTIDGTSQAGRVVVTGQGGGAAGNTVVGDASDELSIETYGLLESLVSVSTYEVIESAQAAAIGRLQISKDGIVTVQNATLHPEAPFTLGQLVPGAICDLQLATCIPIVDNYRLQQVSGKVGSDGDEQITLAFQPIGAISVAG